MNQGPKPIKTTVGILTVGDPAFMLCRAAIEGQFYKNFQLEVISKVSPFNAAFQELVKRTTTEYVIQVDEDMIVFPYSIGRMQEVMDSAPPEVGMILFYLLDPDRNQRIHGIKIFRTEALRKLWARDVKASEMELLEQMLEAGYRWVIHPETMGRHGVIYSPETIYGRYKSMYEKDIKTWNAVTVDIRRKADAFARTGDPVELFAMLGAAHGVMNVPFLEDKEKDFTKYNTKALSVLKQALLAYPAHPFPFEPGKDETKFKNTPIPFEQVAWKNDSAAISAQAIAVNRQDSASAAELVAIDQRIVENIPHEAFAQQLSQNSNDGFMRMWYALSLWHQNAYDQACSELDVARAQGAPSWRVSWYKVMVFRDDLSKRDRQGFENAYRLTKEVLISRPDFEQAKVVFDYLEPSNFTNPGGLLAQDFLSINSSASDNLLNVIKETELEDILSRLEQRSIRPYLVVVNSSVRGHDGASMRELMLGAGYILWHTDSRSSLYRASETLPAPNFWTFKTLLPTRLIQTSGEAPTVSIQQKAGSRIKPTNQVLTEIEKKLAAAINLI